MPDLPGKYGIHRTTVLLHLERNGVSRRPSTRKLTDDDVAMAAAAYAVGDSLATVGARLDVNASTVARAFRRAGLPIRPRR